MQTRIAAFLFMLIACVSAQAANPYVQIETNKGSFVVELYPEKAPVSVANFLKYVENGFYPGTVFHRIVDRFMIQGGGFTSDLKHKPTLEPIVNESNNGLRNERGTLAMARTFDPNSGTSQFFINLEDNKFLNYYKPDPHYIGYAVFGKVIQGMDVVERIGQVPTRTAGQHADVPVEPVVIENISRMAVLAETEEKSKTKKPSNKPQTKGKTSG